MISLYFDISIYSSIYLSISPSLYLSIYPSIQLPSFHSFIPSLFRSFVLSLVHSFVLPFFHYSIHSFFRSFVLSFLYSFILSFLHSFSQSSNHPVVQTSIHSFTFTSHRGPTRFAAFRASPYRRPSGAHGGAQCPGEMPDNARAARERRLSGTPSPYTDPRGAGSPTLGMMRGGAGGGQSCIVNPHVTPPMPVLYKPFTGGVLSCAHCPTRFWCASSPRKTPWPPEAAGQGGAGPMLHAVW